MSMLTPRETKIAVLAAAVASNCKDCVERHLPEARRMGIDDAVLRAVVELADRVKQVPAKAVLDAALAATAAPSPGATCGGGRPMASGACSCG